MPVTTEVELIQSIKVIRFKNTGAHVILEPAPAMSPVSKLPRDSIRSCQPASGQGGMPGPGEGKEETLRVPPHQHTFNISFPF